MGFLDRIKGFVSSDLGLDLGSSFTRIYAKGSGVVLSEPSVAAVEGENGKILAFGDKALLIASETESDSSGKIAFLRPVKDGAVVNFELIGPMLRYFFHKAGAGRIFKPRVVAAYPLGFGELEKKALRDAANDAGARKLTLVPAPMAAAMGAGLPVLEPYASMIADIGEGKTDVAIISLGGFVYRLSVRCGEGMIDSAIKEYLEKTRELRISPMGLGLIKREMGPALASLKREARAGSEPREEKGPEAGSDAGTESGGAPSGGAPGDHPPEARESQPERAVYPGLEILGKEVPSGKTVTVSLHPKELIGVLYEPLDSVTSAVRKALEHVPPELAADLVKRGMVLSGGGSFLESMGIILREDTCLPVRVADTPWNSVVLGCGELLDRPDLMGRGNGDLSDGLPLLNRGKGEKIML
jgi:rod shape-determining protein MreB